MSWILSQVVTQEEYEEMLIEDVREEGRAEGLETGLQRGRTEGLDAMAASIKHAMAKTQQSADQVMDLLGIKADERPQLLKRL